jgi:hypothetical protein
LAATCHPRAARAPLARALLPISEGKRPIVSGRLPCAQAVSLHVLCRLVKSASCVRPCCGLCLVARASAPGAAPFGPKSTNFGAPGRMHLRARGQLQNAVDCPRPSAPSAEELIGGGLSLWKCVLPCCRMQTRGQSVVCIAECEVQCCQCADL